MTVALVLLVGLGFLFVRSVRDTRAAPYTVDRAGLDHWVLAIEPASAPTDPLLVLRPPVQLANGLFRQIFSRAMESLNSPATSAIPLLLQGEFRAAFAGRVTPEALLEVARKAGLDASVFKPRCLGYRRVSEPGVTQQLYFLLFEAPAFQRFRLEIAGLGGGGSGGAADFDPAALSPVLFIAAAETVFSRWLPLRADPNTDCVAPISLSAPT